MVQLRLHRVYPHLSLNEAGPRRAGIHQRPPRAAVMPRTRWTPSPCDRLSRPRTTTGPPPRPGGISRQRTFPAPSRLLAAEGTAEIVPTFTPEPFNGLGAQLCPCNLATPTPQTFSVASRSATLTDLRSSPHAVRVRVATQPRSVRFELAVCLRGFVALVHRRYTFPSRLPNPRHLTVLTRPGVVRAACRHRPRSRGQAALSFSRLAATSRWRCPFITARLQSASWRSTSEHQTWFGRVICRSRSR